MFLFFHDMYIRIFEYFFMLYNINFKSRIIPSEKVNFFYFF